MFEGYTYFVDPGVKGGYVETHKNSILDFGRIEEFFDQVGNHSRGVMATRMICERVGSTVSSAATKTLNYSAGMVEGAAKAVRAGFYRMNPAKWSFHIQRNYQIPKGLSYSSRKKAVLNAMQERYPEYPICDRTADAFAMWDYAKDKPNPEDWA